MCFKRTCFGGIPKPSPACVAGLCEVLPLTQLSDGPEFIASLIARKKGAGFKICKNIKRSLYSQFNPISHLYRNITGLRSPQRLHVPFCLLLAAVTSKTTSPEASMMALGLDFGSMVCGWLTILERVSRGLSAALTVLAMLGLERSRLCGMRARSATRPFFSIILTMLFIEFC